MPRSVPKPLTAVAVGVTSVIAVVGAGGAGLYDEYAAQVIDDVAQFVAGLSATASCLWNARRHTGAQRSWRLWMGIGTAGWSVGQAIWSWFQLVLDRPLPSPSWSDAGYLTLPVFALLALISLAGRRQAEAGPVRRATRLVVVLDGLVVVGSLFALTWATTLGAVVHAGAPTAFAFSVAVAYPITDLMLAVIVVLLVATSRAPRSARRQLGLLGAGLFALAFSDSVFAYLVSMGAERMPPLADAGFIAGPVLIAVAAATPPARIGAHSVVDLGERTRVRWGHLLLPYAPVAATGILIAIQAATGARIDRLEIAVSTVVIVLLVVRQAITLVENAVLLERVSEGQARLAHQAFHDALTGLANRALFRDRLDHALTLHRRDGRTLAVLFVDLDDFKAINDRYGHEAGDKLLRAVGERLAAGVRAGDTVARLGGDEFAVLLEEPADAARAAERLLMALRRPYEINNRTLAVGASVGLATADEPALTADSLLQRADAAMYAGKRQGKNTLVQYGIGLASDLPQLLSAALIKGDGLEVHYQPIVRLTDGAVVAVEALARWSHPTEGPVPADVFIALAERVGLIGLVDDFVLDRACRDAATFRGPWTGLAVHVNRSAARLGRPEHEAAVHDALNRHGLAPSRLLLELTETARLGDLSAAAEATGRLAALGVLFALDDFGTGYNALAQLHALKVDVVKLDRSFTADDANGRGEAVCRSIVAICAQLGVSVVAEGIETARQAATMETLGCRYGQGHHFGRPGPLAAVAPPDVLASALHP